MYILDAGIARRYKKKDYDVITKFLTHIIKCEGLEGANALIEDSINTTGYTPEASNLDNFRSFFVQIVQQARDDPSFFDQIGNYVTGICDTSSKNKVMLNSGFISIALSIRVMEGVALALHKNALIWKIANKIILKEAAADTVSEGIEGIFGEGWKQKLGGLLGKYGKIIGLDEDSFANASGGTKMKNKFEE
jgi:predicted unusual protein kinase regulating ubiquinone biosynthesis (AarF/ABC1/UbiB family)